MSTGCLGGVASVDITPSYPVLQGGFGQRTTPSEGVLDPVMAKALHLRVGATGGSVVPGGLLLVTADLICMPAAVADPVAAAISARTGLDPARICISASHTHSGPLPADGGGAAGVERYHRELVDALIDVGVRAVDSVRPVRVGWANGRVDVLLNRRTRGTPNHVDDRVPVLRVVDDADGRDLAVLFGVGCHPVTLGWDNPSISADFPGVAQRAVEAARPGITAMFVNGTEGNVVPVTSPNRDALDPRGYAGGTLADTHRIGTALAEEVLRVLPGIAVDPYVAVDAVREDLLLTPRNAELDLEAAARRLAAADAVLAEALGPDFDVRAAGHLWALASRHVVDTDCDEVTMRRLMVACCEHLGLRMRIARGPRLAPVRVPVQVLRIGGLELLALPGEVLVEVGDAWRERAGHDGAHIVGLANAHLRYLPHPGHFDEPEAAVRYETITAGLDASGMSGVLDAAGRLLARTRSPHPLP